MIAKLLLAASLLYATYAADTCIHCICLHESGCKAIGCEMDVGSLSCGYYQIKLPYYEDCGTPGRKSGEDLTTAWKRCADDYTCSTQCVNAPTSTSYKVACPYTGDGNLHMARLHNGGPSGCKISGTEQYWNAIKKCCSCT
ncbi:Destabilase [Cooperia oncophora]